MIRKAAAIVLAAALGMAVTAAYAADSQATTAFKAAQSEAKSGPMTKMGPVLRALYKAQNTSSPAAAARSLATAKKIGRLQQLLHASDGYVTVDIALNGSASDARRRE